MYVSYQNMSNSAPTPVPGLRAGPPGLHRGSKAYLLVLIGALLPYLPCLGYGFVYDDDVIIQDNPAILSWGFVPSYFVKPLGAFYTGLRSAHYYRPMVFLWLRINDFLFGLHPWGWHLTNILLHAAASLLVLLILRKYFPAGAWAAFGAVIFAVHPAHIETVAWVSGCTDSLMAVGLLGAFYLWLTALESPSLSRHLGSLACFAVALLTKETAVVLPVMIFTQALIGIPGDDVSGEKGLRRFVYAVRQAIPYVLLDALYLAARFLVFRGVPKPSTWISGSEALLTVPSLLVFYLRHLAWPFHFSVLYDFPVVPHAGGGGFWAPLILLAAIMAACWFWFLRSKDQRIMMAALWFLFPLAPVLNIGFFHRDDFVQDRYLYLPVLAVSILLAMAGESLSRAGSRQNAALAVSAALMLALGIATMAQIQPWQNNLSLYTNAVRVAPHNAKARNNLASEYSNAGRYQDASELLSALLRDEPNQWLPNYNYGYVNYRLGNLPVAKEYLSRAIRIDPSEPDQFIYLGTTYFKEGQLQPAEELVRHAIALKPDGVGYHIVLGVIKMRQGDLMGARTAMLEELKYHPNSEAAQAQLQAISAQLQK